MIKWMKVKHIISRFRKFLTPGLLLLLLNSNPAGTALAQATVTPDHIEVTLEPGACAHETVTVAMGEAPIPNLDVVLVIDVTGSMSDVIDEVTRSAGQIVNDIRALVPDTAFALVTLADYPNEEGLLSLLTGYGEEGDYPWRLDQDLTPDESLVQAALNKITIMDGGDDPESYLRALYETRFLSWREGSRRIVILFGDSYPHDPDPGRDETEGTDDDLTQDGVIAQLAAADIVVLAVYTNLFYQDFYQAVADGTGGQAFILDRVEQIPPAVRQMVEATVTRIRTLTLEPGPPGDTWLRWEPDAHHDVAPSETRDFALTLCVPEGTLGGDYTFDLTVTGDGATIGRIPVMIHIPAPAPTPMAVSTPILPSPPPSPLKFPWWWLLIPLLLLLLLAALWWWLRHSTRPGPVVKPGPRKGPVPTGRSVHKTPSRPRGADVTHGRGRPSKRT